MGGRNVAAVYTAWSPVLSDRSMRLLAFMANVSRDDDPQPIYWGGRDMLVECAMGRWMPNPDRQDAEAVKVRRAAYKSLADTIQSLKDKGAIQLLNRPAPGRQAEYLIVTERVAEVATVHAERAPIPGWDDVSEGGTVHAERAERYTLNVPSVHAERADGTRSACTQGETNTTNTTINITPPCGSPSLAVVVAQHQDGSCSGWLGTDDLGRLVPCLVCKPHLTPGGAPRPALRVINGWEESW